LAGRIAMAEWAYACRQPGKDQDVLYISAMAISDLPAEQLVVRVKVGAEWRCAVIDRSRRLEVASQLIRPVIASSLDDCPQCEPLLQADDSATQDIAAVARTTSSAASADSAGATTIQVAMLHDVGDGVALI